MFIYFYIQQIICCVITLIGANSYFEEFPYKKSDNNIQIYDNLNTNSEVKLCQCIDYLKKIKF